MYIRFVIIQNGIYLKKKYFYGTKQDLLDGYIHLSARRQVKLTLKKHFFKKDNLILLKIRLLRLKSLKWEKSTGTMSFPHLYSYLKKEDIISVHKAYLLKNGLHIIRSKY